MIRENFNSAAYNYQQYRPHYPAGLFDKLIAETDLSETSKVLEIGPGTGQATGSVATVGCEITAIELGAQLANKARSQLAMHQNVTIHTGNFEEFILQPLTYDLVFSATAFHWIEDAFKFSKPANILKSDKWLAIIDTAHVSDEKGDTYFLASQPIYKKYWPGTPEHVLPTTASLQPLALNKDLFQLSIFDIFPVMHEYSADDYAGLLSTYSPTLQLPPTKRTGFLHEVKTLINDEFDGKIEKQFAFTLAIAQKL